MAIEENEMEIIYEETYEDRRRITFDQLYNKITILLFGVIPFVCLMIFEVVMIIIGFTSEFSYIGILLMITLPSIYIFVSLMLPIGMIIIEKVRWKFEIKMPKERKWSLNKEGIIIDEIFRKQKYSWDQVSVVRDKMRNTLWFHFMDIFLGFIPKRVLDDDQMKQLKTILLIYLESDKVKLE